MRFESYRWAAFCFKSFDTDRTDLNDVRVKLNAVQWVSISVLVGVDGLRCPCVRVAAWRRRMKNENRIISDIWFPKKIISRSRVFIYIQEKTLTEAKAHTADVKRHLIPIHSIGIRFSSWQIDDHLFSRLFDFGFYLFWFKSISGLRQTCDVSFDFVVKSNPFLFISSRHRGRGRDRGLPCIRKHIFYDYIVSHQCRRHRCLFCATQSSRICCVARGIWCRGLSR